MYDILDPQKRETIADKLEALIRPYLADKANPIRPLTAGFPIYSNLPRVTAETIHKDEVTTIIHILQGRDYIIQHRKGDIERYVIGRKDVEVRAGPSMPRVEGESLTLEQANGFTGQRVDAYTPEESELEDGDWSDFDDL